jgi:hypothetical protein
MSEGRGKRGERRLKGEKREREGERTEGRAKR